MNLLFELSLENNELAAGEGLAAIQAEGYESDVLTQDNGILALSSPLLEHKPLAERLALCHNVHEYLLSMDPGDLSSEPDGAVRMILSAAKGSRNFKEPVAVAARRIAGARSRISSMEVERLIGGALGQEYDIDLEHPAAEINILFAEECHIGIKLGAVDRKALEARKAENRPYVQPISLHPKYARALVNLARCRRNQTLLDPFCGTGGILIEAGLLGARPVGCDIEKKMVEGTRENLDYYGLTGELYHMDFSELEHTSIDAIATDPPYGRSATTGKENVYNLYERAFRYFAGVLKPGGYAAVVLPDEKAVHIGAGHLALKEEYELKVHGSLVRRFCVFKG